MLSVIAVMAVLGGSPSVEVKDFRFLAGRWEAKVWGGVFEETWSEPRANSLIQMGRHTADGKLTFMEFATIEQGKDGKWTMYLLQGALSKGDKKPTPFKLESAVKGVLTFGNPKNDFPTHIRYTNVSPTKMKCEIYGSTTGKDERETFNFERKG